MGNIKTCVDTSRIKDAGDDEILEKKFALIDKAHKYLYDPETGKFRTMAEALEMARRNSNSKSDL